MLDINFSACARHIAAHTVEAHTIQCVKNILNALRCVYIFFHKDCSNFH